MKKMEDGYSEQFLEFFEYMMNGAIDEAWENDDIILILIEVGIKMWKTPLKERKEEESRFISQFAFHYFF